MTTVLPEQGQEFRVLGERGVFRFYHVNEADGSYTAWGPVDSQQAQWRSFRPIKVTKVVKRKTQTKHGKNPPL